MMRHTRNYYHYLIRGIKKNGDLAVRRSLSNALLRNPSRDYRTEVKKIHKNKFTIQNRVDDKTGTVDIANAFSDQYSMLYSSVPSEPTCLSELLKRIDTSVRNVCPHNYFCIQHCHFVYSTQISDVIKRLYSDKNSTKKYSVGIIDKLRNIYITYTYIPIYIQLNTHIYMQIKKHKQSKKLRFYNNKIYI